MQNIIIPSVVRSLHNFFSSIWIGGMLVMVITFLPTIRKEIQDKQLQGTVIDKIMSRHSRWVYFGIVILSVTGLLMARLSGQTSGLFNFSNPYGTVLAVKHILMIIITVIALTRSIAFKNAASSKDKTKKKISMALLMINTLIGTVILVLSSVITLM
ncbi:MAG: CopD family protein [Anaerolineaceae bacterium]|nr:CopD family protein [Anaerolineaceae bacterium]